MDNIFSVSSVFIDIFHTQLCMLLIFTTCKLKFTILAYFKINKFMIDIHDNGETVSKKTFRIFLLL